MTDRTKPLHVIDASNNPLVKEHPGWVGSFSRSSHLGAIPNGTRVKKVFTEPNDTHPLGAKATVLGSVGHPAVGIGYFVEWDERPRHAVFVASKKIAEMVDLESE